MRSVRSVNTRGGWNHRRAVIVFTVFLVAASVVSRSAAEHGTGPPTERVGPELPDPWQMWARERAAADAARRAQTALDRSVAAREKAQARDDAQAAGIAREAIGIAEAALRRARADLMRLQGMALVLTRLREVFARRISDAADAELEAAYGFVHHPAYEKRLASIVHRLKRVSLRPAEPVAVKILNPCPIYMAAATATTIYFDLAYLEREPSEDELMFVAAHELAHGELDHSVLYVANDRLQLRMQDMEGLERFNARDNRAFAAIRDGARAVAMGAYSREQELQADILGAHMALNAGARPQGIKTAMDRLASMAAKGAATAAKNLSPRRDPLKAGHPAAQERLSWLEKALGKEFWNQTKPMRDDEVKP